MANQTPTEEKMHYESLMGLFKYALTFFSVIAIIITFLIGNNLTEIKKTISEDVKESAKKLETVKTDADKTVADTKADAKQQLADMKQESQLLLNYTKDLTTMQINLLKEDAKNLALSSARNKVEEAFKNNNLQSLIDITARKEVSEKLNEVVRSEADKTKTVLNDLSNLTIAYQKISQQGSRWYLDYVDNLSNKAQDNLTKEFAKSLLIQSGKEYENSIFHNQSTLEYNSKTTTSFFEPAASWTNGEFLDTSRNKIIEKFSLLENASDDKILKELFLSITDIKRESSLTELTVIYWHLRKLTGIQFKNFDSKPVIDWYYSKYGVNIKNQ